MQATIKRTASFNGVGLHSGLATAMKVRPAPADHGIWFRRVDVVGLDQMIPAVFDHVSEKPLCTRLVNNDDVEICTVEHIMAALAGCGIHNAIVEVNGPEVPIMDGCSAAFVKEFIACGIEYQNAALYVIEVLEPVTVEDNGAVATLSPASALEIGFSIEFSDAAIGRQNKRLNMGNGTFVRELCDSRTFCRKDDIDAMHAQGLALGGSYYNAVVVDGEDVLSPGGLRYRDEAVRHKMLDALGDLALAGMPILGRYEGHRAGHAMTNRLLRKLLSDMSAFRIVECTEEQTRHLPGVGVKQADLPLVA